MEKKSSKKRQLSPVVIAVRKIDAEHKAAQATWLMLCEAHHDNILFNAHVEALAEAHERILATFSNKERNAQKRAEGTLKTLSTFCKSSKPTSQAFRIDEALATWHTMRELLSLPELSDCREARVKSHISFLIHNFAHTCTMEVDNRDRKTFFRFVTKK